MNNMLVLVPFVSMYHAELSGQTATVDLVAFSDNPLPLVLFQDDDVIGFSDGVVFDDRGVFPLANCHIQA
jgi:hypothetical protein